MTYKKALQDSAKARDTKRFVGLLDKLSEKGANIMAVPMICDVNRVGYDAHRWAWDTLEDWQDS